MIKEAKKKIGLYGGTFDPVHNGHINLAIRLKEAGELDELIFCPASCSPNKEGKEQASPEHRLAMLRLAVEEISDAKVDDRELRREGLSYTIDTLEELIEENSDAEIYLLMGADSARTLHSWHRVEDIVAKVPLLVGCRERSLKVDDPEASSAVREAIRKGIRETAFLDISATNLRGRLKNKLYCGHLVFHKVLDYIDKNGLYCSI